MHSLPLPIQQKIADHLQCDKIEVEALAGDASSRTYFRIHYAKGSMIWMDLRTCPEVSDPFQKITQTLQHHAVACPNIHLIDTKGLLIDDLGTVSFEKTLSPGDFQPYEKLIPILTQLARVSPKGKIPLFSAQKIHQELRLFTDWYLPYSFDRVLNTQLEHALQKIFDQLTAALLEQPQVFVHRDFHCRNLMVHKNQPVVIDYQDAVWGPISYDSASLLKDCYISIPRALQLHYASQVYHQLNLRCSRDQWIEWFDLTGVQRHLKVLGIFTRLKYRDKKPSYVNNFPRIKAMLRSVIEDHPSLKPLIQLIEETEEVL